MKLTTRNISEPGAMARKSIIERMNRHSFEVRAMRLVARLNAHCKDQGLDAYLSEWDTWNADYPSDVKLLMGEAFEIMRLQRFVEQNGLDGDLVP